MNPEGTKYLCVKIRDGFTLKNNDANKWFLTKQKDIFAMQYAEKRGIYGVKLQTTASVFKSPFNSSLLNVFQTNNALDVSSPRLLAFSDVLCKFVVTNISGKTIFVPLHHTYL